MEHMGDEPTAVTGQARLETPGATAMMVAVPDEDLRLLLEALDRVPPAAKGESVLLLAAAARRIALHRAKGLNDHDGGPLDAEDWLCDLATECMPRDENVADLISHARSVDPNWEEAMFPEGYVETVLSGPNEHASFGQAMYMGYSSILANLSWWSPPPSAAECIGVDVPASDFTALEDDGEEGLPARPVHDRDAWLAEVDRQCIEACAQYVTAWRCAFLAALVDAKQPSPRLPYAHQAPSGRAGLAFGDDELERLFAEIDSATPQQRAEAAAVFNGIPGMEQQLQELDAVMAALGHLDTPPPGP